MVARHPEHVRCRLWLARAVRGELEMVVAGHTVAELYGVLSTLPTRPRLGADRAWRLIEDNVIAHAEVVSLDTEEQVLAIRETALQGMTGGIVYDALIARAARKAKVDVLLTLNESHFKKVWPDGNIES